MKKLEIDIATLAVSQVSKFTAASGFFQRPGDCSTLMVYYPEKNKIAAEIYYWTSGKFYSLKLRHSLNYCRSYGNYEGDVYVNLQDGFFNNQNCYIDVNYHHKFHSGPPKLSEIKKAWPDSLPKLSSLLQKIAEYLNESEIKEFISRMKLIETRGTRYNAMREVNYL